MACMASSTVKETRPISVYVHWPYCKSICPYCDFNRYLPGANPVPTNSLQDALLRDMDGFFTLLRDDQKRRSQSQSQSTAPVALRSIFFGGGSPSLAPVDLIGKVIAHAKASVEGMGGIVDDDVEVTLETNPTSAESSKMAALAGVGVNRLSIGLQSLRQDDLTYLGREHSVEEAKEAVRMASDTFARVSADLIYARHREQSVEAWTEELGEALGARNEPYVSLHADGGEEHSILSEAPSQRSEQTYVKRLATCQRDRSAYLHIAVFLPEDEVAAAMYEATCQVTAAAGLHQYEVSNFAKPGQESEHNMNYWRSGEWLGLGPGAASRFCSLADSGAHLERRAVSMLRVPEKWERVVGSMALAEDSTLTADEWLMEVIMMGLRTARGLHVYDVNAELSPQIQRIVKSKKVEALVTDEFLHVAFDSEGEWRQLRPQRRD